jgi:sulfur-oxidizing protein SoxA
MKRLVLFATVVTVLAVPMLRAVPALALHDTALASPESVALAGPFSGYRYRHQETRAIQDDDEMNPAFLWIDAAAETWSRVEGAAGKACESCHGRAEEAMKGVGARYPKHYEPSGKPINLEQRINLCRTENMQAPAWDWETSELLAMTTYVKYQSRGMPVTVDIDGPARPFFEAGKSLFHTRLGQIDMACSHCHDAQAGKHLRAQQLSQGQINGFPAYFLGFQRVVSVNFMFRFCNKLVRATPYDFGSEEYVNLELYMAWRGQGLPVESPSIR